MNISDFEKSKIFQENTLFEIAFHNALINAFDASRSREQATRASHAQVSSL
jgi:hypothetical protein